MSQEHRFGFIALIGPPNAGKSTLMNTLLGQKLAIVTPKAQTTRNRISGILSTDDAQVVFLDTPGIHQRRGRMNRMLLDSAWNALAQADVCCLLVDAAKLTKSGKAWEDLTPLRSQLTNLGRPLVIACNKVDRTKDKAVLLPVMQRLAEEFPEAEIVPVSALTGDNTPALLRLLLDRLPMGPAMFPEDQLSTLPLRFLASEIVREQLFLQLREELPYNTAVEIEVFDEPPHEDDPDDPRTHVAAVIYVSRDNHKGMVIGKGGARLKDIGTKARLEMEEMIGSKVFLELYVKVRHDWTEDTGFLRMLGMGE